MEFGHTVAATQKEVAATLNRISALIKPKPEQETRRRERALPRRFRTVGGMCELTLSQVT